MDESLREFVRMLTTPVPYMTFCERLRRELNPSEFVDLVGKLLQKMGGEVTPGARGADETIDLLLKTDRGEYIVQCKRWKAKVGVQVIREVYGAAAANKQIKGALIVTTSEFTSNAHNFTIDLSPTVRLIEGKELFDLISKHMPTAIADIRECIK